MLGTSVSFYLTNQFDTAAPFTALIVPTTVTALRVRPVVGSLPPYGTKGDVAIDCALT